MYTNIWFISAHTYRQKNFISYLMRACEHAGIKDPQIGETAGAIHATKFIVPMAKKAKIVIGDLSNANDEVIYSIGIARALQKQLILIVESGTPFPSFAANIRKVVYDPNDLQDMENRLAGEIKTVIELQPNDETTQEGSQSSYRENQSVFISYSHKDKPFLDRLLVHLRPLERENRIDLWVDTRLKAGDQWRSEIQDALQKAKCAILLVSADFLASRFIAENELPPLLEGAEKRGVRIVPLILKPCRFTRDPHLGRFQAVNDPEDAMILVAEGMQERFYDRVAIEIEAALGTS